jgi:hypothetical protein
VLRSDITPCSIAHSEANHLSRPWVETEAEDRAKALANAVYADCRTRCVSDASRRLVYTVLAILTEYEASTGRKYARHGKHFTRFASAVEGFIGDLMLARNNSAAGGWIFRSLNSKYFIGSEISRSHLSAVIAGLEFVGLIERAPPVRRFGADLFVSSQIQSSGGATRFRSTLKLSAMARDAGVDLGAPAEHSRPLQDRVVI